MKPIYPFMLLMIITSCANQPENPKQSPVMEQVDISNLEKSSEMLDEEKY